MYGYDYVAHRVTWLLPKAPSSVLTGAQSDPQVRGDNKFILHHEISVCDAVLGTPCPG